MRRVAVVFAILVAVSTVAPMLAMGAAVAQDDSTGTATTNETTTTQTPLPPPNETATATEAPPEPTETPAPATSEPSTTETPAPAGESSSGWSLSELRRDGEQPSGSPASVRFGGDRMLWLIHWPASALWADVGNPQDGSYKFVGSGEPTPDPVTDSSVFIRAIRKETGTDDFSVKVVSYRVEEVTTTADDGSTTTERVPADVREKSVDVSLARGWSIAEVKLPNLEEDREILMYVEGQEDTLRWTFSHEPVATSQSAPISTEGDYLLRVGGQVFLPALGLLFGGGFLSRRAIQNAGKGPGLGLGTWALLMGIGAFLAFALGPVNSIADVLVAAPTVMAVFLAAVATIVFLESYEVRSRTVQFVKLDPYNVTSPTATSDADDPEEMLDAMFGEESTETVVEMPDGTEAVVRDGLFAFLSRALGGCAARLSKKATRQARIQLEGDNHDELVFVAPDFEDNDDDSAIRFKAEGWEIVWPEIETWHDALRPAAIAAVIGAVTLSVWQFEPFFGAATAAVGAAVWLVRPTEGDADFKPAKGHLRAAIVTSMLMATDVANAETLEGARKKNIKLRARSQKEVEEELDKQDATIIEESHGRDVERQVTKDVDESDENLDSEQLDALEEASDDD
jgi:hypothetical protein